MTTKAGKVFRKDVSREKIVFLLFSGILSLVAGQAQGAGQADNCKAPDTTKSETPSSCVGVGVAVGGFFFDEPDITGTTIAGTPGVVRITEKHEREASAWLELHDTFYHPVWAHGVSFGPFAALQLGASSGSFSSFAVGGMFYFPLADSSDHTMSLGFGLGVGYGWTQIHRLGPGIVENQPLPAGETTVRFQQADIGGPVIMLSTSIPLGK